MSTLAISLTTIEKEIIYTDLLQDGITIQQGNIVYIGINKEV